MSALDAAAERARRFVAMEHGTNLQSALEKVFLDAILCERRRVVGLVCKTCQRVVLEAAHDRID